MLQIGSFAAEIIASTVVAVITTPRGCHVCWWSVSILLRKYHLHHAETLIKNYYWRKGISLGVHMYIVLSWWNIAFSCSTSISCYFVFLSEKTTFAKHALKRLASWTANLFIEETPSDNIPSGKESSSKQYLLLHCPSRLHKFVKPIASFDPVRVLLSLNLSIINSCKVSAANSCKVCWLTCGELINGSPSRSKSCPLNSLLHISSSSWVWISEKSVLYSIG
jgi:hypothetical protein